MQNHKACPPTLLPTTCSRFLFFRLLLLLFPLGDLHLGRRPHRLHLDLLLPCKRPKWPSLLLSTWPARLGSWTGHTDLEE